MSDAGVQWRDTPEQAVDPSVSCGRCDAVCCRLTVVLMPEDAVPGHLTERSAHGVPIMARDEEGWCVAIDARRMRCSIYDSRPRICRSFARGGAYCRDVRESHRDALRRGIPLTMY
ncbi:MAG TPA: YkgJ family cysteine cluster protein [Pseudoxanthomonas sp.]|nr:YkgJ family cysteine cluster protein [Pseudoxanthomonas sp.]